MLPFPKRNATDEEVELNDDDLLIVDEGQIAAVSPSSHSQVRVHARASDAEDLAATVQRALPRTLGLLGLPPGSRRVLDEQVEEDVAGLCLASIAEATSRESVRQLSASSHIRAALASAPPPPPPVAHFEELARAPSSTSRLPSVTAPPFVRTSAHASLAPHAPEAPGIRESAPPPAAFARRSIPDRPAVSVAPVSMPAIVQGHTPEPTVILVRERPRAIWILAAAVCGAFGALAATRLLPAPPPEAPAPVVAAAPPAAPLPLPSPVVVAPVAAPAPSPPVAPAPAAGNVMRFGDDQGVAIKAITPITPPAPQPARKPAPAGTSGASTSRPVAPRAPSMGPALPDGSFGLSRSESASAAATPPPSLTASAVTPSPEPRRARALTPEQQLAEAQLKASMK